MKGLTRTAVVAVLLLSWGIFSSLASAQISPAVSGVNPIDQRASLTEQLFAGNLSRSQESALMKQLSGLARQTVFSSKVYEGDPIAFSYTVKEGDTLAGIVRRLGLNVPTDVLEQINGDCDSLQPGRVLKLLRGPFRAQINKHNFTMYVYLQGADGQKVFARSVKVALGKNDGTPVGSFRIAGKGKHVTWTPPPSMAKKYKKPVEWGQKGYPLGKDGYFMSLRGTDAATRNVKGYGIHGTNAQWSIGKAASHGCIRVAEGDIGALYSMMAEGVSTVEIVP